MTEQSTVDAPEQVDASELNSWRRFTPQAEIWNGRLAMLGVSLGVVALCCGAYWRPRRACATPEDFRLTAKAASPSISGLNQLQQGLVGGLHAIKATALHDLLHRIQLTLLDVIAAGFGVDQDVVISPPAT